MTTSDTHTTSGESAEVQEAIRAVRPLNATQAKALRTLVQQDFAVVERDMQTLYEAEIASVKERIEEEWKAKGANAPAFEQQAHDLLGQYDADMTRLTSSFESAIRALVADARSKGVVLTSHLERYGSRTSSVVSDYGRYISATVEGKDVATTKAVDEVRRNFNRAVTELQRNQTNVERRILVAQVTGDAEGLLAALPTAQALMLSAAAEQAAMIGRDAIQG